MGLVPFVSAITLTANATNNGIITINSTQLFRRGAIAYLNNSTPLTTKVCILDVQDYQHLYVKKFPDGPNGTYLNGTNPFDLSAFTTALSSTITQSNEDSGDGELGRVLWALDGKGSSLPVMAASIDNTSYLGDPGWSMNLSSQTVLATSTVNASVAITSGYYWLVVSGVPAALNIGAAANVTTNILIPVGASSSPVWFDGGSLNAITSSGTGQVALISATPKAVY